MQETLCWSCKHTNRDECPWFDPDNPQPVDGWEAIRVDGRAYIGTSYTVLSCPKFERIEPRPIGCDAHPGIYFDETSGTYVAYMVVRKEIVIIGRYKHAKEALRARRLAERLEAERVKQGN